MQRVVFTHRCGALAEVLAPEGDPAWLERKRRDVEGRVCPYCEGDDGEHGWQATGATPGSLAGAIDLFHWRDVTEKGTAR